jgi:HD-GYP domain-containing protein (c-di-GMP phosphodiesterase class II)
MSSDRPSGGPSPTPDLAALIRDRGAPLIEALEAHVPGAAEHAAATGTYAFAAAVELGFERVQCETAREAAKLHDVGHVYLPPELLSKPAEALSDAERSRLHSHHEAGAQLARGAGIPELACAWILHARERFDGRGPDGLVAIQIPLESRLIRAACACDALLAEGRQAVDGLRARGGRELDPRVVEALIAVITRAGV